MPKRRRTCRKQKKITGSYIPGMDTALHIGGIVLGWLGNVVWDCIKFLGITGLTALRDLITDLWKDGTKRKIKTDNLKTFINVIKRRLAKKNPNYRNEQIFADISELNRLCYYIENLNEEGMESNQQEEIQKLVATHLKNILKQFKKIMSAPDKPKVEPKKETAKKEEPKKEDKKEEPKKDDKKEEKPKEEPKKTTNRRYRRW